MKTLRQVISTGGIFDGTGWDDFGAELGFAALSAATELLGQIIQAPTADAADQPAAATPIVRFYGGSIVLASNLAAQSGFTLVLNVRRAGSQLGSAGCFGWTAAGGGTPAFTAYVPVALPDLHASNTNLTQAGGSGPYFVRLLAADVLTVQFAATVPSVPAGLVQLSAH